MDVNNVFLGGLNKICRQLHINPFGDAIAQITSPFSAAAESRGPCRDVQWQCTHIIDFKGGCGPCIFHLALQLFLLFVPSCGFQPHAPQKVLCTHLQFFVLFLSVSVWLCGAGAVGPIHDTAVLQQVLNSHFQTNFTRIIPKNQSFLDQFYPNNTRKFRAASLRSAAILLFTSAPPGVNTFPRHC